MVTPTKKKPDIKLSLKEVADRLGENVETVRGWRKRDLFPRAELIDTPRGPVWQVPLSDLENFQKPVAGRPPTKSKAARRCL